MGRRRLVLFDIDGTLVHGGRLWAECFYASIAKHFPEMRLYKTSFGGKTDRQIYRELLVKGGLAAEEADRHIDRLKETYLELARREVVRRAHEVKVLPGVNRLIDRLREHADVVLALLTGNLEEGAKAKLGAVGLWEHFRFGAFADDHWDRYQLPEVAVRRARQLEGHEFHRKEIVIVGDTVHDVKCGARLGVRTIAVGTGAAVHKRAVLEANPDFYFPDLSKTDEVMSAIFEELVGDEGT
ncbi:MAG TPA: HAD hydrolase-like protein [Bdellovibrionales bacterium]|nr:HAD hydrolase-like protein [Bdellovibrionales bacterium]